jgi:DNA-binding Lrp family transcriptional regulator
MPQITCPNCGTTISLENRKKIDFDLITGTVKRGPKKFTDLLKATRLSRKTLSLRLKEMCESGILVKLDGKYDLNSFPKSSNSAEKSVDRFSRLIHDRRMKLGLGLILLVALSSTSGYGLATYVELSRPKHATYGPPILGNLTVVLDVNNVEDMYGWQAVVTYNASEMGVLKAAPGGFLSSGLLESQFLAKSMVDVPKSVFCNATISEGTLLLGGCLVGQVPGVNGSGTLAVITFALFSGEYNQPKLVRTSQCFETFLLDSHLSDIALGNSTLTLSVTE